MRLHHAVRALIAAALISLSVPLHAATTLTPVVTSGITNPLFVGNANDGSNRLFILQAGGVISVLQPGSSAPTIFLDIHTKVLSGGELGLLGLAFHPQYATNRRFFVFYTRVGDGALVIAEYGASSNPNVANTTETVFLTIPHPSFANHNGGMLAFGPDTYLHIGTGDGGSANDPGNNSQNINSLLGKILRIDVNTPDPIAMTPYSSPSNNPFVGVAGRDEIFAFGLRNPWRFSFDRATGQQWVGDVGQGQREEVNVPLVPGGNYGWRVYEGNLCTGNDPALCTPSNYLPPRFEYAHTGGRCSITGGYVYRGSGGVLPSGTYVYGDYCTGEIFTWNGSTQSVLFDTTMNISSFGEDELGEIYVVDLNGTISKLTSSASPTTTTLVSSANPAVAATNVTLTATVNGSSPTGTVNFIDGGNTLSGCAAVPLTGSGNSRTAACSTSSLTVGSHSIVATYSGDGNNAVSSSPPFSQTINAPPIGTLIGHWALDEVAGTVASDSSGNNHNGSLVNGPVWTAGKINNALSFDGVNDYVSIGDAAQLRPGNVITLAGWINLTDASATRYLIAKEDEVSPPNATFLRYQAGGSPRCAIGGTVLAVSVTILTNQWYHLTCTYDGSAIRLYVNGTQQGVLAKTGAIADEAGVDWLIGARRPASPAVFMKGQIDDVRLYNVALTAAEVLNLFNATGSDTTPPVRSNGSPSGILPAGTTQATVALATDENATCKYSTAAGTAYSSMTNTFSTTGGTSHSMTVSGLTNGGSYNFYVRCQDAPGNVNTSDFAINFSVAPGGSGPNPIAHWRLDETSGTTALDASGNNHNGSLVNGPVWTAGKINNALSFDGVNDYVLIGDPAQLRPGNVITLAGWINLTDASATRYLIAKEDEVSPPNATFLRYQAGGSPRCAIGGTVLAVSVTILTNQWYHLTCTYDGSAIRLYVNGTQQGVLAKTGAIADEVGVDWLIGARRPASPAVFMKGQIDDVRLYNVALTAAEVLNLFNNPVP